MKFRISPVERSDWSMKDIKYTCEHASSIEAYFKILNHKQSRELPVSAQQNRVQVRLATCHS